MLADMKKGSIFALVINNNKSVDKTKRWCCSSVWLECLPVTQEVASSSLVSTAKQIHSIEWIFCFYTSHYYFIKFSFFLSKILSLQKMFFHDRENKISCKRTSR